MFVIPWCNHFRPPLQTYAKGLECGPGGPLLVVEGIMYVCMYACMYVCMHACMYVCMHACMYVCMHGCMYVCMHAWMDVCMYVCMNRVHTIAHVSYILVILSCVHFSNYVDLLESGDVPIGFGRYHRSTVRGRGGGPYGSCGSWHFPCKAKVGRSVLLIFFVKNNKDN